MKAKLLALLLTLSFFVSPIASGNQMSKKDKFFARHDEGNLMMYVNAPEFKLDENLWKENIFLIYNTSKKMVLSITFEKAKKEGDAEACRDDHWNAVKSDPTIKKSRNWKYNDMKFKDFVILYNGDKQKHLQGCLVKNNTWIGINLSKSNYKSRDRKLFTQLLKNIEFVNLNEFNDYQESTPKDKKRVLTKNYDYYVKGNQQMQKDNYKKARIYYRKALNLEKRSPKLNKRDLNTLINNLGAAYALEGSYKKAETMFKYGLKVNSKNPDFYYNLGAVYAEQEKLEETLKYLDMAYKFRKNDLRGEKLLNPLEDDSFKKFWNNSEFKKLAKKINNASY